MTMLLTKEFGVPEVEVVRAFPDDRAVELDAQRWEDLIRRLEGSARCMSSSPTGQPPWRQTASSGISARPAISSTSRPHPWTCTSAGEEIGAVFAVEKPGHLDGRKTLSFQFFDRSGHAASRCSWALGPASHLKRRRSSIRCGRSSELPEPSTSVNCPSCFSSPNPRDSLAGW